MNGLGDESCCSPMLVPSKEAKLLLMLEFPAHVQWAHVTRCALATLAIITSIAAGDLAAGEYQPDRFDINRVVGYEQCQKCHLQQVSVLQQHPHYLGGRSFHRRDDAKAMAKKLGYSSVKRSDLCMKCHYTPKQEGDRVKAVSGVSCESCHGPARDWIQVHNNYGPLMTKESESPEHRAARIDNSISRGMNPPGHLYSLARACVRCHVINDERLVNEGGHPASSKNFEFVAWSQGNVRHNFLRTDGRWNQPSDIERRRVMYVVGLLAELEASLRATAKAKEKADFAFKHAARSHELRNAAMQLARKTEHPLIQKAAEAGNSAKLKLGNSEEMIAAADSLSRLAWQIANEVDGKSLEGIDSLLPGPAAIMGNAMGGK